MLSPEDTLADPWFLHTYGTVKVFESPVYRLALAEGDTSLACMEPTRAPLKDNPTVDEC